MEVTKAVSTSIAVLAVAVIGWQAHAQNPAAAPTPQIGRAVAVVQPTAGNQVKGIVTFTVGAHGVLVHAEVTGLPPNSTHGFHIHEFGDLRSDDGKSLGGHYNPGGHMHALPTTSMRHAGDLGNLKADAKGVATLNQEFDTFTIDGEKAPILGRGLVIHALPDDGGQPTGNAGGRIAVGVIGVAGS
ncbi:MAG: superoxide dismutase family protein [Fimbriimonadaceae bacterium]|nr:superoxide dismutase family protein [Fimbriimonadaceae bacterium]